MQVLRICKRCGRSEKETKFYDAQRMCAECMSITSQERMAKEKEWIKNAKYKTEEACREWNNRHRTDFGDQGKKFRIDMGLESYTNELNIKKDRVEIR